MSQLKPRDTKGPWGVESPRVKWFRLKHREQELHKWDSVRVARVCRLLHCTVHELCAACGLYRKETVNRLYKRERTWPVYLTIQFERFEISAASAKLNIPQAIGGGDLSFAQAFGERLTSCS